MDVLQFVFNHDHFVGWATRRSVGLRPFVSLLLSNPSVTGPILTERNCASRNTRVDVEHRVVACPWTAFQSNIRICSEGSEAKSCSDNRINRFKLRRKPWVCQ